jgi:hypothetical protein
MAKEKEKEKPEPEEEENDDSDIFQGFEEDEQRQIRARAASNLLTDRFRAREKARQDKKEKKPAEKKKGLFGGL